MITIRLTEFYSLIPSSTDWNDWLYDPHNRVNENSSAVYKYRMIYNNFFVCGAAAAGRERFDLIDDLDHTRLNEHVAYYIYQHIGLPNRDQILDGKWQSGCIDARMECHSFLQVINWFINTSCVFIINDTSSTCTLNRIEMGIFRGAVYLNEEFWFLLRTTDGVQRA